MASQKGQGQTKIGMSRYGEGRRTSCWSGSGGWNGDRGQGIGEGILEKLLPKTSELVRKLRAEKSGQWSGDSEQ